MTGSDEDRGRSRRLGAYDRGWSSTGQVLGGRMIKRSGEAVCSLHHAQGDEEHGFLGLASTPWSTVFSWFGLKADSYGSCGWASKPLAQVSRFGSQNW
jgi:hypothetical protein